MPGQTIDKNTPSSRPLVIIAGPTATGKTSASVALARRLNGSIISADSMQVYRGMDIGTAKIPVSKRKGIPHHLIDVDRAVDDVAVAAGERFVERPLFIFGVDRQRLYCLASCLFCHIHHGGWPRPPYCFQNYVLARNRGFSALPAWSLRRFAAARGAAGPAR